MKSAVLICVLFFAALTLARPDNDHYTENFDNLDVDEILGNSRLYNAYLDCIHNRGKCTPAGTELKSNIPDALQNGCAKCTEKQKMTVKHVMKHLINHKDADWKELTAKYDPDNKYRSKYEKELREITA